MFKKYGLNVTLVKQPNWEQVQQELHGGKLDAAQTLFAMPLWEYFSGKGGKSQTQGEDEDQNRAAAEKKNEKKVKILRIQLP